MSAKPSESTKDSKKKSGQQSAQPTANAVGGEKKGKGKKGGADQKPQEDDIDAILKELEKADEGKAQNGKLIFLRSLGFLITLDPLYFSDVPAGAKGKKKKKQEKKAAAEGMSIFSWEFGLC